MRVLILAVFITNHLSVVLLWLGWLSSICLNFEQWRAALGNLGRLSQPTSTAKGDSTPLQSKCSHILATKMSISIENPSSMIFTEHPDSQLQSLKSDYHCLSGFPVVVSEISFRLCCFILLHSDSQPQSSHLDYDQKSSHKLIPSDFPSLHFNNRNLATISQMDSQ